MTVNFNDILNRQAGTAEKPKPLPGGTWLFSIKSHRFDTSTKKGTPFVEFTLAPTAPDSDVDTDHLTKVPNWKDKELRLTYYFTEDALWRLDQFLNEHLSLSLEGRPYAAVIPETTGRQFRGFVTHVQSQKDQETWYAEINQTAAA